MSTLKMLEDHLKTSGAFTEEVHPFVLTALNAISGEVPYRLKLSIALSELITITSHMRKPIELHDGTIVPCNAITFALAGSGISKDSSMNMVRRGLKPGYDMINEYRKDLARHNAEQRAVLEGKKAEDWLSFYEAPRDLQPGLGSPEGLVNHFAILAQGEVGAAAINSSEIGSELQTNGNLTEIIKIISIGYDLGKIPAKIIKSSEHQTSSVDGLPINALLFGSQDGILYDNGIKNRFKTIFNTQLARRSIFSFSPETMDPLEFDTIQQLNDYRNNERDRSKSAQETLRTAIMGIIENTTQVPLTISDDAQSLFDVYKEYNTLIANDMNARFPINQLARRHKQWLSLKLSGNLAIIDGNEEITAKNYIDAINMVEIFAKDLMEFEKELVKEPYEIFTEFCHRSAEDGKFSVGLHDLRKLQYIPTTGSPKSKLEELVQLASSCDPEGIYTVCESEGICYEEIVRTDIAGLSYVEVSGTKDQRAKQCAEGFEFYETDFEELAAMLTGDYAYSPFRFLDGKRANANILGGCKFVALDIDDSTITDEECHFLLEGINHHIARTSDKTNQFKFRVLVELDSVVSLEDRQWRYFLEEIGEKLGLNIDVLPKSQIYFSYSDRTVLSETEGEPLETKNLIIQASDRANSKPVPKKLSVPQQKALLDDKLETYSFAFNADDGEGSRALVRAGLYAIDLGATQQYVEELIWEINDYWAMPMDNERIEATILPYLRRKF